MCGRFSITGDLDFYAEYFGVDDIDTDPIEPSWNVAPTDPVYVVAESDGRRRLRAMRWGLVPHWAPDTRSIHINARAETVATTAAFRDSFARKRCLIPADGFYEWRKVRKDKQPYFIRARDRQPFAFAGIWETWVDRDGGEMDSAAIITCEPNRTLAPIHNRMPVIVRPDQFGPWLDTDHVSARDALALLGPAPDDYLEAYEISSRVNSVKNDGPENIEPVAL